MKDSALLVAAVILVYLAGFGVCIYFALRPRKPDLVAQARAAIHAAQAAGAAAGEAVAQAGSGGTHAAGRCGRCGQAESRYPVFDLVLPPCPYDPIPHHARCCLGMKE